MGDSWVTHERARRQAHRARGAEGGRHSHRGAGLARAFRGRVASRKRQCPRRATVRGGGHATVVYYADVMVYAVAP